MTMLRGRISTGGSVAGGRAEGCAGDGVVVDGTARPVGTRISERLVISRFWPFSKISKSALVSPVTGLPARSRTTTSTLTTRTSIDSARFWASDVAALSAMADAVIIRFMVILIMTMV